MTDRLRLYPDPSRTAFRQVAAALARRRARHDPGGQRLGRPPDDHHPRLRRAGRPGRLPHAELHPLLAPSSGFRTAGARGPVHADWTLDPADFAQPGLKLVFLANPNSPRARPCRRRRSPSSRRARLPAVVDEAYADFAGALRRPGARPPQRDRHPIVQQGLQPGRPPPGLPDRPAGGRRPSWSRSRTRITATPSAWPAAPPRSRTRTISSRTAPGSWRPGAG